MASPPTYRAAGKAYRATGKGVGGTWCFFLVHRPSKSAAGWTATARVPHRSRQIKHHRLQVPLLPPWFLRPPLTKRYSSPLPSSSRRYKPPYACTMLLLMRGRRPERQAIMSATALPVGPGMAHVRAEVGVHRHRLKREGCGAGSTNTTTSAQTQRQTVFQVRDRWSLFLSHTFLLPRGSAPLNP